MEVNVETRIAKVQQIMSEKDVDLMLFSTGSNMRYLTGFEAETSGRHMLLAVPASGKPMFFTPHLVREEVKETGVEAYFWEEDEDTVSELESFLSGFEWENVLLDDQMWELFSRDIRSILDGCKFGLASQVMDHVRAVKSNREIEQIRKASEIADKVVEDVRSKNIVGMTENELRDLIEDRMKEYGGEGPSFDTTVAAGENSSRPHHVCSERTIESGDPITMDFGCVKNGYVSDQTRTIVAGDEEPSEKFKEVHRIVKEAQQKGVDSVEPGMQDRKLDEIVRSVIEEAEYGEEFIHRTGHGVGVEVHESPKIPPKNHETSMKLDPGMIFSIEPGIYIEGELGVRIEDLVLVTKDGCERLNKTKREWS